METEWNYWFFKLKPVPEMTMDILFLQVKTLLEMTLKIGFLKAEIGVVLCYERAKFRADTEVVIKLE